MARKKKTDKDKEISLEEAQNIIKRLAHPKHVNQEEKLLKEAAAVVLKETQPEFEFGDDEDSSVEIDTASVDKATSDLTKPPGFLEQLQSQISAIGPAGVIALSSAAYFQVDTVVEETRTVATVAEEKWEEVKFEHPNINWDDPLAGFTTIIGIGDIEIDLDPPDPEPVDDTTKGNLNENKSTTISEESDDGGEKGTPENDNTESGTDDEPVEDDNKEEPVEEEKEEPKKKKKGLFGLFGGDDEEEAEEEAEEESEPEAEAENEETTEEESSEPEPEAEEEQVEEKPKKKSGGLFSSLFGGGDDEESEEPEDENREEPTQDDQVPEEQTDETEVDEPETEEVAETTTDDSNESANGITAQKKSSGGLLSLFGFNNSEKEVVEESEVSTDEEPVIEIAELTSESEAPQISDEEPEIEIETIDAIDDIKPHSMVEVADTEINIEEIIEVADVAIEEIEVVVDVDEVIQIDDVVEETVIETVLTPNPGTPGTVIVSPAGGNIDWSGIFGPSAPGYDSGDKDATPI